ncbi:MAG: CapA family protein [Gammaproteobacteria bacterium]|nr:CapA family protein [Gammaproteobacteria bacterium]
MAAVGDIMLGTDFPDNRLPDNDASILSEVASILASAELTFGNLEGTLADGGEPAKKCKNPSLCYLFRTPTRYVQHLADAGFDMLSLANNHARDFGEEGRSESMRVLAEAGIAHSGREGDVAVVDVNEQKIAMIAFAPNIGAHPLNDIDRAAELVRGLADSYQLVIVSFHGGAEGIEALHVKPGVEIYYGEQRGDLIAFAHAVIDAGADLVIGHGPHVPRGMEIYQNRLIAYSLGNFATHYGISVAGIKGLAPILFATLAHDGRFLSGRIVSTRQSRPIGPIPDPKQEAFELMKKLSLEDFGPGAPLFGPNGEIFPPRAVADVTR